MTSHVLETDAVYLYLVVEGVNADSIGTLLDVVFSHEYLVDALH